MRKNTASQIVSFQAISTTDGSDVTSGSPAVYYTIDGGTQATGSGTTTHEGNGQWSYAPAQAETNGNHVAFTFVLSGAVSQTVNVYPVAFDPTDAADLGVTALTGHTPQTGDSFARLGAPAGASVSADIATVDGVVDSVLVDTGTTLPATLSTMEGKIDTVDGIADSILVDTGTTLPATLSTIEGKVDTVDGVADAILVDTNELQADWADGGRLDLILDARASQTSVDTIDGIVDSILDDTGTSGVVLASNSVTASVIATDAIDADALATNAVGEIADGVWDEILTGATHNISTSAGRRLREIVEVQVYEGGHVWIDTVNGAAGTTDYENGTVDNPSSNIADATALATSVGLTRFRIAPNSSFTLASTYTGYAFIGDGIWTLALGGQQLDRVTITNAIVSGTCTTTDEPHFEDCEIGNSTLPHSFVRGCRLTGTIILSEASDYHFESCMSGVAGTGSPAMDFGASVGSTNLNMRHYSGGIEIQNMGQNGTDNMSLEGDGALTINANCTGGTIALRGNFKVTDNASGAVTIVRDDSAQNVRTEMDSNSTQLAAIVEYTGTTIPAQVATLNDISVADVLTTAMTESYGTDGSDLTLAQACYLILGNVSEFAIAGTTKTVKQLDGSSTAATYTLDDASSPTSITRAT